MTAARTIGRPPKETQWAGEKGRGSSFWLQRVARCAHSWAGVWTDVPNTADCPDMDAWRQASFNAGHLVFPAPWPLGDCPANFGNNDISSATTAP